MDKFIQMLKQISTETISKVIMSVCSAIQKVFGFLDRRQEIKQEEKKQEKKENDQKELKNVCDNGSLDDLINLTGGGKK